ncbi:hypothetical protein GE09DRAFT_1151508 [Coniochaeta sp. 2T2.1]|nr:hypothetical protein GE09DRAFT_1151508 [Coniochaeta sp. 2T2.1]
MSPTMLLATPASFGTWKEQLNHDIDQKITRVCGLVLSWIPAKSPPGATTRKPYRPDHLRASIESAFAELKKNCNEEIERRLKELVSPKSRADTGDSNAPTIHDSGGHQADLSDGTQTAGLSALDSRQNELTSFCARITPEGSHGAPPIASGQPRESVVNDPPLPPQRTLIEVGDAASGTASPDQLGATRQQERDQVIGASSPHQSSISGRLGTSFILDRDGLGDRLVSNLESFMSEPTFAGAVYVRLDENWLRLAEEIRPTTEHNHLAVGHVTTRPAQEGVSKLLVSNSGKPKMFGHARLREVENPSQEDAEAYYDTLVTKPPVGEKPYYVGPMPQSELDSLFPSGKLAELPHTPGVNSLYGHLGAKGSGTAFHQEDAKFRSYNLVLAGYKFWILIAVCHSRKFEALVERCGGQRDKNNQNDMCAQWVRHRCLLFSLEKLRQEQIDFQVVVGGPGVMVVTQPEQYHWGLAVCSECGFYHLEHPNIAQITGTPGGLMVSERRDRPALRNVASPNASSQISPSRNTALSKKRKAAASRPSDSKRKKPWDHVPVLAAACRDRAAFLRLCSLVMAWRDRTLPLMAVDHDKRRAPQLVSIIDHASGQTPLTRFIYRFANLKLAEETEVEDYKRTPHSIITGLLEELGKDTKQDRCQLLNQLHKGREWRKLCVDGLLSLIPLVASGIHSDTPASAYRGLAKRDDLVKRFQDSVSATSFGRSLLNMGKIFEEAVWLGKDPLPFRWEDYDIPALNAMRDEELEALMEIFPTLTANYYNPVGWPKPDFWTSDWPANPTVVPVEDQQCQFCAESGCQCIDSLLPDRIPHLTGRDGRGQGVRAIGSEGEIVYLKGQILGELLGELVPLDSCHDGRGIELCRPDFSGEPPIAQINTKNMGNWVRKVNHSCPPAASAEFRVMKISGFWREMLVAITDIPHNGEITANCGKSFLKRRGIKCLCKACR